MDMFCYQCQETAKGTGCTLQGVCGKKQRHQPGWIFSCMPPVASQSSTALCVKNTPSREASHFIIDALFTTITNANFDNPMLDDYITQAFKLKTSFADKRKRRKSRSPVSRKSSFRPRPTNMKRLKRSQVFSPKKRRHPRPQTARCLRLQRHGSLRPSCREPWL